MSAFWNIFWDGIGVAARWFGALLIVVGVRELWAPGSDLIVAGAAIILLLAKPISITINHPEG
jgi:hypothetical protein